MAVPVILETVWPKFLHKLHAHLAAHNAAELSVKIRSSQEWGIISTAGNDFKFSDKPRLTRHRETFLGGALYLDLRYLNAVRWNQITQELFPLFSVRKLV